MAQVIYGNQFQGGLVRIPPSKSAAHRQVLCAALSRGKCTLSHVDMSEDIQATVAAVEALGAKVIGVRRSPRACPDYADEVHTLEDLDSLLPRADVVALTEEVARIVYEKTGYRLEREIRVVQ